jgi:hypothetical protein
LHLLCFIRVKMTLEEVSAREAELRQEIAERERLLVAYQLIRADWEKSLPAGRDTAPRDEPEPAALTQPSAPPVPPAAPVHVLPPVDLEALSEGYGGGIRLVTWAIRQMPDDFTVHQIATALQQAGCPIRVAKVSVVLHRMKQERKVEEITTGRGRTPSLFRATARAIALPLALAARRRSTRRAASLRAAV